MRFTTACTYACTAALALTVTAREDKSTEKPAEPCKVQSPLSGYLFDLNGLYRSPPSGEDGKPKKGEVEESYLARGYDYGANFTLNFCGPVVEMLDRVEGVEKASWGNVSAYYTVGRRTFSIGQESTELLLRGRKLVLKYTGGSPCDADNKKRRSLPSSSSTTYEDDLTRRKIINDDGDDNNEDNKPNKGGSSKGPRRKAAIISLLCDKDPVPPKSPLATVSFIGASEDECTYFFEARTAAACALAAASAQGALGPGGVFGVILLIALMVYFLGGCVYQRTVLNQRGWRQLPNYSMWAALGGFLADIFVILTASCARFLPGRRGYSRVSLGNGNIRGRDSRSDAENRLIDSLDEEWDD